MLSSSGWPTTSSCTSRGEQSAGKTRALRKHGCSTARMTRVPLQSVKCCSLEMTVPTDQCTITIAPPCRSRENNLTLWDYTLCYVKMKRRREGLWHVASTLPTVAAPGTSSRRIMADWMSLRRVGWDFLPYRMAGCECYFQCTPQFQRGSGWLTYCIDNVFQILLVGHDHQ